MVIILMVEEHDPLRQFLRDVLDVHYLNINLLPLILYVLYTVFQCSCLANFLILTGFSFMYSGIFWLKNLISKQTYHLCNGAIWFRRNNKDDRLDGKTSVQIYRRLQVISRVTNVIFGSFFFSVHIACCLGIGILCSFGLIRWHDSIPVASSIILFFAVIASTLAVLVESLLA